MVNKAVFFCHYGSGDIFESREFVREYIEILGTTDNYYAHCKSPYILKDMPELKFTDVTSEMNHRSPWKIVGDTIYINMWIGRDSKYVLPEVGVVVEEHFRMHNDILRSMKLRPLSKDPYHYIPNIDYSVYETDSITEFLNENTFTDKIVLISNGPVQSCQAENFDFTPVIKMLCEAFPYRFIATQKTNLVAENLSYTDDIIHITTGTDLNEISYLSTYCDVTIGRNSGPHVFSQVLPNWLDRDKMSLSFTYGMGASHFVYSDSLPMKKEWSSATDTKEVFKKICEVIE